MIYIILPQGRCGCYFHQSLLSDHPDIITVPGSGLFRTWQWLNQTVYEERSSITFEEVLKVFHSEQFSPVHVRMGGLDAIKAGPSRLPYNLTLSRLTRCAEEQGYLHKSLGAGDSQETILRSLALVHNLCLDIKTSNGNLLLNADVIDPIGSVKEAVGYSVDSSFKVIMQGRGLKDNIESLTTWVADLSADPAKIFSFFWMFSMSDAIAFKAHHNAMTITLEELKTDTLSSLNRICSYLGISYHSSLHQSTFCGSSFTTPLTTRSVGIQGFASAKAKKGYRLTDHDAAVMGELCQPYLKLFGLGAAVHGLSDMAIGYARVEKMLIEHLKADSIYQLDLTRYIATRLTERFRDDEMLLSRKSEQLRLREQKWIQDALAAMANVSA